ncbi:ribosome-binding factor A [Blattabacterium cuenoti]|uniref:ribosome-binding factor A n=1 Tax=Blattabacterium cuenoti TaxID=1653831 RepID=UPI00163BDAA2|nr:ribosome-binding factor A [Blattabacterium cuenoti]
MIIFKTEKLYSIFYTEIAEIINENIKNFFDNKNHEDFIVTLIKIKISYDMNSIIAYINIYPFFDEKIMHYLNSKSKFYRKLLSKRLRYRVKKIPKLFFIFRETIDY